MKKQINKVLIALIFSTVVAPAYGSFGTDLAAGAVIASATGLLFAGTCAYGGAAALIGKTIIDRLFPKKNEQSTSEEQPNINNRYNNIIISGCIGGFIAAHSAVDAVLGAGSASLCNAIYDWKVGKDKRDYNSNKTTFMSGAIGIAVPALIAIKTVIMAEYYRH